MDVGKGSVCAEQGLVRPRGAGASVASGQIPKGLGSRRGNDVFRQRRLFSGFEWAQAVRCSGQAEQGAGTFVRRGERLGETGGAFDWTIFQIVFDL